MNSDADATAEQDASTLQAPRWLRATLDDVLSVEFEAQIAGTLTADCYELFGLFQAATSQEEPSIEVPDTPATRVCMMLSAVTGMYFKPRDKNEPFSSRYISDSRRSAIPADFRRQVDVLSLMAVRAQNPVLRARLSDVCWLLDKQRSALALAAVDAYTTVVQKVVEGELQFRFANECGEVRREARDYLQRALQIGRSVGWDKAETLAARELTSTLLQNAIATGALNAIHWFGTLALDFSLIDPVTLGDNLVNLFENPPHHCHVAVEFWRLAARAYHLGKKEDGKNRCLSEAAERLVAEANSSNASPLLAAHFLSSAISALHGVPGKRDRRTELRHKLIDVQSHVLEEMVPISHDLDLTKYITDIKDKISSLGLIDQLFRFAKVSMSPDPQELRLEAIAATAEYPLASLFGGTHLDDEGKVIYRNRGAGSGDQPNESAIAEQIAQRENIRRTVTAHAIEAARQTILDQHHLCEDIFRGLLRYSPFVPPDLIQTYSRGFARFFQGDSVSSVYILTPLLENSLRYVLKARGHDVTIFDDATQTQKDHTLSSLFQRMRQELDEIFSISITADIEHVFLTKPGPYLRHALSHGLLHDGDPYGPDALYGCWLIFRLCLLPLFPHSEKFQLNI